MGLVVLVDNVENKGEIQGFFSKLVGVVFDNN